MKDEKDDKPEPSDEEVEQIFRRLIEDGDVLEDINEKNKN
jgi:hypothetical protein